MNGANEPQEDNRNTALRKVLDWDLPSDTRDTSASGVIGWSALVLFTISIGATVFGWFALAWNPHRGIIVAFAAFAGPLAALATAIALTARGPRKRRRVAIGVVLALSLAAGWIGPSLLASTRATPVELRYALEQLKIPGHAQRSTLQVSGDRMCRTNEPTVIETFVIPGSSDPAATVVAAIHSQGFGLDDGSTAQTARTLSRGPIQVTVQSGNTPDEVLLQLTPSQGTC